MTQSNFGAGFLFGTPSAANSTPRLFGAIQDVSIDFGFDLKKLYGQQQAPLEQARGKLTIDMKASIGRIDPNLFNDLFFNNTIAAGDIGNSILEAGTIPGTPFAITVANSATFSVDLGVYNRTTGLFMSKIASAGTPTTGQYKVAAGVYTFAAADAAQLVSICYTYSSVATGKTITGTNLTMGSGPIFQVQLVNTFRGKNLSMTFPAVQSSKLSFPLKIDDFVYPSIDMSAQDDGSGNVFSYSSTG